MLIIIYVFRKFAFLAGVWDDAPRPSPQVGAQLVMQTPPQPAQQRRACACDFPDIVTVIVGITLLIETTWSVWSGTQSSSYVAEVMSKRA